MTNQQRKTIENEFYNYTASNNAWREVFDKTLLKFAFEREEQIIRLLFIEHKQKYTACRILQVPMRTLYYGLNKIYEAAYLWAKDLKLL